MARSFNGSTDLIDCGTAVAVPTLISISVWVYATSLTPAYSAVYCRDPGRGQSCFHAIFIKSNGKIAYYTASADDVNVAIDGTGSGVISITPPAWHHLGLTFTNAGSVGLSTFFDGASDGTAGSTALLNVGLPGNNTTGIGYDPAVGGRAFGGIIFDAAMWNVALSVAEMQTLAKGARPYMIRPTSLVHYLPLDGLQSPEPDLSGNAKNGTLTGTVYAPSPPVMMFTPRWPNNEFVIPAPSFIPAWARQSNLPVIGAGTY